MKQDDVQFKVGDLVKYRDELPTDFHPRGSGPFSYGDIGIVCEAPTSWDRNDTKGVGVVYINSKNNIILAHKKDLIKINQV